MHTELLIKLEPLAILCNINFTYFKKRYFLSLLLRALILLETSTLRKLEIELFLTEFAVLVRKRPYPASNAKFNSEL